MDIFYLFLDKSNFKNEKKYFREHFAGRFIVEYAAKNYFQIKNSEIEIINNKPQFKYSDIKFSISHSNNVAAVCFDKNPVGFDIEFIKQRNYISIAERMKFNLNENSLEEFYKCWTKYEAEYKLQIEAKSFYSGIFIPHYAFSVASSEISDINIKLKNIW